MMLQSSLTVYIYDVRLNNTKKWGSVKLILLYPIVELVKHSR